MKDKEKEEIRPEWSNFTERQQRFLSALDDVGGNITAACMKSGVKSRNTVYEWMKKPDFKKEVDAVNEANIDFVESKLMNLINQDNPTAIIFYLKTKGKKRGYIETNENINIDNPFEKLMKDADSEE